MENQYCFTTLSIIQTLVQMRIGGPASVKSHVSQLVSQHGAVSSKAESRDVFFVVVVVNGGIGVFGEEVVRYCCISSTQRGQSLYEIATFDFSYVNGFTKKFVIFF